MLKFFLSIFCVSLSILTFSYTTRNSSSLDVINNQRVVFLKGSPYERGFQHGKLLQSDIEKNIKFFLKNPQLLQHPRFKNLQLHFPEIRSHIPEVIIEELQGLSDGANADFEDVLLLNLFPEMFHCSGITASKEATTDGSLYHVRALDYRVARGVQNTAVAMVCTPEEGFSYINISYAGFIGCVTGMNSKHISLGEVGGNGYDHLNGLPMAFLMKLALEKCETLDSVVKFFKETPRTGEYYYIISDGKTSESLSVYATNSQIHFISPGSKYALLAPSPLPKNYGKTGLNDKFFLENYDLKHGKFHCELYSKPEDLIGLFFSQLKDTLVVTGFAYPSRYDPIVEDMEFHFGKINHKTLIQLLRNPEVSRDTNIHTVIFHPKSLTLWVAHASKEGSPAYTQAFEELNLKQLLDK